jgi:hypothetical protein
MPIIFYRRCRQLDIHHFSFYYFELLSDFMELNGGHLVLAHVGVYCYMSIIL